MTRDEKIHLFALGALSHAERDAVARERLVDPGLDGAIAALETVLAPLTAVAGRKAPPSGLFDRVVAAIEREAEELTGKTVLPFADGPWVPCVDGIEVKRLWSHKAMLLRCRPGATLPPHHHAEAEHMIVISGDFVIGGRTLRVGDYHAVPAGNDHGEAHSVDGCVLFIQYAA